MLKSIHYLNSLTKQRIADKTGPPIWKWENQFPNLLKSEVNKQ